MRITLCLLGLAACAHAGRPTPPPPVRQPALIAETPPVVQAPAEPRIEVDLPTAACIDIAHHIADIVCEKSIVDDRVPFTSDAERQIYKDDYSNALAKAGIFNHFVFDVCRPWVTQKRYDCAMAAENLIEVSACVHQPAETPGRKAGR